MLTVLVCRYTSYRAKTKSTATGAIELLVTPLVTPRAAGRSPTLLIQLLFIRAARPEGQPTKGNHAQGRQEEEGQGRHGC